MNFWPNLEGGIMVRYHQKQRKYYVAVYRYTVTGNYKDEGNSLTNIKDTILSYDF